MKGISVASDMRHQGVIKSDRNREVFKNTRFEDKCWSLIHGPGNLLHQLECQSRYRPLSIYERLLQPN